MWELPEAPVEPVRGVHPWLWLIGAVLSIALLAGAYFLPIPIFFAYLPGPVRDVEKLVEVEDARTYSSEGSLYLTTVSVDTHVSVFDIVQSLFDDEMTVVTQDQVTGGSSLRELRRDQRREIIASKRQAQQVALAALGFSRPQGDGARVRATVTGAPADGQLLPGDVILRIDDRRIETTCDVGRAVDARSVGDTLTVRVKRKDATKSIRLKTVKNPEDPTSSFLGVVMEEVNYRYDPGLTIRFQTGEIAGPSAGLMFSLALYDRLTPEDLTTGRDIAGTGTISCDGGVGPIGGIEQKVAGAENRGAEIFLAPQANAEAAEAVADEIEVVPVSTFDDAVEYLEGLE